jgi:hypothetical protein
MLHSEGQLPKTVIYVDVRSTSAFTQGYAFVNGDGNISEVPFSDFWLNIPLFKTEELLDYVDVQKDKRIQAIERQEINPFYLEYKFFDDVIRNKVNNGSEFTDAMVNFILSKRSDIQGYTNEQVREWYDYIGKNELPWTAPDGSRVTVDDIESSQIILNSIVSKARLLKIDIHK